MGDGQVEVTSWVDISATMQDRKTSEFCPHCNQAIAKKDFVCWRVSVNIEFFLFKSGLKFVQPVKNVFLIEDKYWLNKEGNVGSIFSAGYVEKLTRLVDLLSWQFEEKVRIHANDPRFCHLLDSSFPGILYDEIIFSGIFAIDATLA